MQHHYSIFPARIGTILYIIVSVLFTLLFVSGCGASFPHDTTALIGGPPKHNPHAQVNITEPVTFNLPAGTTQTWESGVLPSTLGVEELIASWNVTCPAGTSVLFFVRVFAEHGEGATHPGGWSNWLYLGGSGKIPEDTKFTLATSGGKNLQINVDVLRSSTWFRESQVKAVATNHNSIDAIVTLHRLDVTRSLAFSRATTSIRKNATLNSIPWEKWRLPEQIEHDVPFVSQQTPLPELSGRLCSPASVTMALRWAGYSPELIDVANSAHDAQHNIYGNWPRNVQTAFEFGLPGRVERFGSLVDVYRTLSNGSLIIASIVAKPGELRDAPYQDTDGHLILIRGYNSCGDLLVLDPAARTEESAERTYAREDMTRVWLLNRKGTAYVLWKSASE